MSVYRTIGPLVLNFFFDFLASLKLSQNIILYKTNTYLSQTVLGTRCKVVFVMNTVSGKCMIYESLCLVKLQSVRSVNNIIHTFTNEP